jgi:farnesyl diphosphate synthase
MSSQSAGEFPARLQAVAAAVEHVLDAVLSVAPVSGEVARPERLLEAMRYAALGGGKRIRPLLVVESAALFGVDESKAMPAAAAIECIHCYSLVHDDLPAMDDDELRRGKPTVHHAFDEATAILAGDALVTLAFDLLARGETDPDPGVRLELISTLARAAGIGGMAGGQMIDLEAEGRFAGGEPLALEVGAIERLQAMKTGALIRAACEAGAILGRAQRSERAALVRYARALGLAFQIADDLIDAQGESAAAGKRVGKDRVRGKATLVSALGPDAARARLGALVDEAADALQIFGGRAAILAGAARFVAGRAV